MLFNHLNVVCESQNFTNIELPRQATYRPFTLHFQTKKPNLLKAEGPMVTNTAKSNITYTEIKTKQYKL